jgi:hypothetical protein
MVENLWNFFLFTIRWMPNNIIAYTPSVDKLFRNEHFRKQVKFNFNATKLALPITQV